MDALGGMDVGQSAHGSDDPNGAVAEGGAAQLENDEVAEGGVANEVAEGGAANEVAEGGVANEVAEGGAANEVAEGGVANEVAEGGAANEVAEGVPGSEEHPTDAVEPAALQPVHDAGNEVAEGSSEFACGIQMSNFVEHVPTGGLPWRRFSHGVQHH